MKLPALLPLLAFPLVASVLPAAGADYRLRLPEGVTRPFIAPEIWSTPMMNWRIADGRLELVEGGRGHDVQLLTHQMTEADGDLRLSVRLGELKDHQDEPSPGMAGFKFAVTGDMPYEYRSGLFQSQGLLAGITTKGRLFLGGQFAAEAIDTALLKDLTLVLEAQCRGNEADAVIIAKAGDGSGGELARFAAKISKDPLRGNLALAAQPLGAPGKGKGKGGGGGAGGDFRFWFRDWTVSGSKVAEHPEQTFGPVLWSQYTTHRGVLKLTAHFAPMGPGENQVAYLELDRGQGWERAGEAVLDPLARVAEFRVEDWDMSQEAPCRVVFDWVGGAGAETAAWEGLVRRDPADQPVVSLAALSCMVDFAFPNQYIAGNLRDQDPDVLFFAGDQIYEGVGGFGVVRTETEDDVPRAALNYLSKWWLFGWSFREVLRDRPSVIIPDDHDVYHGNLWGQGGAAMPPGGSTSSTGGYNMHPEWVRMVERTQTSHLPDPFDPAPVKQGIGVYFTDLNVGRVSFAILEDRKFKSAPGDVMEEPVGGSERLDHVMDPDYDTTLLDQPGLELLGERQMRFLDHWAADWRDADLKAVLSQSPFAAVATTHGAPDARLAADLDANGWPQSGRGAALRAIRKAHALMIHGDQHLATLVHHGVDDWNDSGWSYAAPGIANGYKRLWDPLQPGANRQPGYPEYTGEFLDGFRNKVTVWAAANRVDTLVPDFELAGDSMVDRLNSTGSGYGIIRFDKEYLETTVESWPVYSSLAEAEGELLQHEGWPKTITIDEQYARPAAARLPALELGEGSRPVVQVIHEGSGEILYTRRVTADGYRPPVFDAEATYTVIVITGETGDPGAELTRKTGVRPLP